EINAKGPLAEALVAPNSKLPIKASAGRTSQALEHGGGRVEFTGAAEGIELLAREVGNDLYILAASKELRKTQQVEFTGLPDRGGGKRYWSLCVARAPPRPLNGLTVSNPLEVISNPRARALRSIAPAPRSVAPAPRSVAPAPRPVAPAPRSIAPAPRSVAPAP